MPFAIMRNAHEALRASIRVQERHLDRGDVAAFTAEWRDFGRALAVHMAMEDRAMFPLLDEVGGGACAQAGLPAEHLEDVTLSRAVEEALPDPSAARGAWQAWRDSHLHHLEHEEQVMMPLTMKVAGTPEARARVVHDRLLTGCESLPDFDWYVGWVVRLLSEHGSEGQPANVAVRVFAWGLQHVCSPAQWRRLRPTVQRSCAPPIWAEMVEGFGLDGDGKIG